MRINKDVREGKLKQGSLYNFTSFISNFKKDTNLYYTSKNKFYTLLKEEAERAGLFFTLNSLKKYYKVIEDLNLITLKKVIFLQDFFYYVKIDYEKIKSYLNDFEGEINE